MRVNAGSNTSQPPLPAYTPTPMRNRAPLAFSQLTLVLLSLQLENRLSDPAS